MEGSVRGNDKGGGEGMIRYLKHGKVNTARWDACIRNSTNGMIYAYSWYLDAVCPGWEALVKGDYESVMPLTCGKKMGLHYLYPPFFTQQLGVFSRSGVNEKEVEEFLSAIPD